MKRLRSLWPALLVVVLAAAVPVFRLHYFHTESAPIGLWRAYPAARPRIGDVVQFCMRADHALQTTGRPYAGGPAGGPCPHDTWALAKPVIAGPGDTVVHTPDAVSVNGRAQPLSATRSRDSRGLEVPTAPFGRFMLRPGEYWVHSPYADGSFDSRYLGVIRLDQVRGTLRPLVTWLTRSQRAALRVRGILPARCGLVACTRRITAVLPPRDSGSHAQGRPLHVAVTECTSAHTFAAHGSSASSSRSRTANRHRRRGMPVPRQPARR